MNTFKRNLTIGLLPLMLSACGGGGGGSVKSVSNFVQTDLTNLEGSEMIVNSYSNLLTSFNSTISNGNYSSISAVITGPTTQDVSKAKKLILMLEQTEYLWSQTENLINKQSDSDKYKIYNSGSYKEALSAYLYLRNNVKPIIQKVAKGRTITLTDYNIIAKDEKAKEIINTEIKTTTNSYVASKLIKKREKLSSNTETFEDTKGETTVSYTEWSTIYKGGGDQTRTKTISTKNLRTTVTTKCSFEKTTLLNGSYTEGPKSCNNQNTFTLELAPTIKTVVEKKEGENPIISKIALDDIVTTKIEKEKPFTLTTFVDAVNTSTDTIEGSSETATVNRDEKKQINNQDNTSTIIVTRYIDTITTTPITTLIYRTRHYTDTIKQNSRVIKTTTPLFRIEYKDGSIENIKENSVINESNWKEEILKITQRSENILLSETQTKKISTITDNGKIISQKLVSNKYTDEDINLGYRTSYLSENVYDHKTFEYKSNKGLDIINAASAYARGWTGKGAVLGVIDTFQDVNHKEFKDKYLYFKNYDLYRNNLKITQGHGSHVAGIIAANKDGDNFEENGKLKSGVYVEDGIDWSNGGVTKYKLLRNNNIHGVAYDSKLVGANVDRFSNGWISKGQAQNALKDFAKLKSPKSNGGEKMNIVAVNMSFNSPQLFYDNNGLTTSKLTDGTFKAEELISKIRFDGKYINESGSSKYYKTATDNDIILVNSAGNYGFEHAGEPGIWATEVDDEGQLILGGKMVIVGDWNGVGVSGNKAGHVCLDINTAKKTCNDKYKISDFYILAPGTNIYSSVPNNEYVSLSGTSMAAPHVTGAFGILNQMWPYMKGENLVKLLMNTANKDLPNYNINIHGQGLLDLNEATRPQGALGVVTTGRVDHPSINLNNSYFSSGSSIPSDLQNLQIMVLDDYDKNYFLNIGETFVVKDKRKISDIEQLKNGEMYMPINQMYGLFSQGNQWELDYFNFGLFTGENGKGDYSTNIGKKIFLSDKLAIASNVGQMKEVTTWLGNSSDGVFSVGKNNITNFINIGVSYKIKDNDLSIDYSTGNTAVNTVDKSLITDISNIKTESYRLAYKINKDKRNTFGWSLSLPNHITSGKIELKLPQSVNLDGTINYEILESNLEQEKKERNLGFFYNYKSENDLDASFNIYTEYRQNIAGETGRDGVNFGIKYTKKFSGACGFFIWKNPKCYNPDGSKKNIKAMYLSQGNELDDLTKYGLKYDSKTDKFVQIDND